MTSPIDRPTDPLLEQLLLAGEEEDAALPAGSRVGRYVVLDLLGTGGMSVVYKAYDPQLDRAIALKLMRTAPAGTDRVLREAQALARLSHPNVVAVHDAGTYDDKVFAAMEYVAGESLGAWCKNGKSPEEILSAFRDAGRGLAAAHAAGLVHRDFKPDNAIVGKDGRVRVLDFGLARAAGGDDGPSPAASAPDGDARATRDGAIAGTPAYMAPEQHLRRGADARSDQFAFCVALWEALYGRVPFAGDTVEKLRDSVTSGRVSDPPADTRVPAWVRPLLLRGLAVDPAARHPSMDALVEALDRKPSRRRAVAMGAIGVVALAAVAVLWLTRAGGDACAQGDTRLRGIWDDRVRSAVHSAFVQSGRAHAIPTFERVVRVLDGQAAEWIAMQRDVCEARQDDRETADASALRQSCLDERRSELGELTAQFAEADARVVDEAVHAAFELPSVSACTDVAALRLNRPTERAPDREACGAPAGGRFFPLEAGRVWVYDLIDKATRRSRSDPKVVTIDGPRPIGGCRGEKRAFRMRQESREGWAFRWQIVVPENRAGPAGIVTQRLRDEYYSADGTKTKDVYYVPSRIRLDETCAHSLLGATYLDAYDEVDVEPGSECDEVSRESRTFEWKVVGVDVSLDLDLDYTNRACCRPGTPCRPPPDGPGHSCVPAGPVGKWRCRFRTLQVDRREVSGRTAASYSFAVDVGKVLDDEKGEDREVLTCFSRPR